MLVFKFGGDGRHGIFRVPIQLVTTTPSVSPQRGGLTRAGKRSATSRAPTRVLIYGKSVRGGLTIGWEHRARASMFNGGSVTWVRPFYVYLPAWARVVRVFWRAKPPGAQPQIGFTASSPGRHLVVSASWDWARVGMAVRPFGKGGLAGASFESAVRLFRRTGSPPWLAADTVNSTWTTLRRLRPEDMFRLSLGIKPRFWQPAGAGKLRAAMALAAASCAPAFASRSICTLFCLQVAGVRVYYGVKPEIQVGGEAVVAGENFYVFGETGSLRSAGYVATADNTANFRGIGLAAGATGLLGPAGPMGRKPAAQVRSRIRRSRAVK